MGGRSAVGSPGRGRPASRAVAVASLGLVLGYAAAARADPRDDEAPAAPLADALPADPPLADAPPADPPLADALPDFHPAPAPPRRIRLAAAEVALVNGIGAAWYWAQTSLQVVDWELRWDSQSWYQKLTSLETIRFDTNPFVYNAIRHPFAGALYYQAGRAAGLGPGGASVANLVGTVFWEYVVEFKEIISLNDLVVNLSTGLSVGEAARQIGLALRARDDGGLLATALGAALAPWDAVHDAVDGRRRRAAPWHRFEVESGLRVAWPGADRQRLEAVVGVELEVFAAPELGLPGRGRRRLPLGAWSRIEAHQSYGGEGTYASRLDAHFAAHTILNGRHERDLALHPEGVHGWERLVALSTGFTYDTRYLADQPRDRFALTHLIGARGAWRLIRGPWTARLEGDVHLDFGMIQAHVFQPDPPFHPEFPFGSALQAEGYYFGGGGTARARLVLARGPLALLAEGRGHIQRSIDGADRHELGGVEDPHGVSDERWLGRAGVEVRLGPVRLGVIADGAVRRGAWSRFERTTRDGSVTFELAASP